MRIGDVIVEVAGNVGRCAVTTPDPDTGLATFDTPRILKAIRGDMATTEKLPFGVWAHVLQVLG